MPSKNCHRKKNHRLQNTDSLLEVMIEIRKYHNFLYNNYRKTRFPGANVICHVDTTQYHKNQIPQKLEQTILSSCTHVLFCSADTNFDTIANNWYSSQSNGTKNWFNYCTVGHVDKDFVFIFAGTFSSVARLKKKNPSTKVLLLVNGISPESVSFSRRDFIISVSDILKTSGFDGLVLSDASTSTYSKNISLSLFRSL